jgi:hypothetical protein
MVRLGLSVKECVHVLLQDYGELRKHRPSNGAMQTQFEMAWFAAPAMRISQTTLHN